METKKYRVRTGCRVNQDSQFRTAGEIVELTDAQFADPAIYGLVEPMPEPNASEPPAVKGPSFSVSTDHNDHEGDEKEGGL